MKNHSKIATALGLAFALALMASAAMPASIPGLKSPPRAVSGFT